MSDGQESSVNVTPGGKSADGANAAIRAGVSSLTSQDSAGSIVNMSGVVAGGVGPATGVLQVDLTTGVEQVDLTTGVEQVNTST